MRPKIGIKTKNIMKTINEGVKSDVIELISCDVNVEFSSKRVSKIKKLLDGKDLSMHSQTSRVFSSESEYGIPDFVEAELHALRSEVILCKVLGAKELIFHLRDGKLTKSEIDSLRSVFNFAEENGVEMIYESNWGFVAEEAFTVLKEFPELNYNLDLGHLNMSIAQNTLGMSVEDFISRINDKVVYVHAHNNDGVLDQHRGIEDGTLDWKKIFGLLDFNHVRKVMAEVWDAKALLETKNLLEEYFDE